MPKSLQYKNSNYIEQAAMFLLIANTANPFFYLSIEMLAISFLLLTVLMLLKRGFRYELNKYFWIYAGALCFLQLVQSFVYHVFPLKTFFGEYLRIAFAVLAICLLGEAFFSRFIRFVYIFAVISLCFYIPCILIKGLVPILNDLAAHLKAPFLRPEDDLYASSSSLIIFNLNQIELGRNSGFYWEPGTHGGFLILAIFLNLFYRRDSWKSKYNLVFFLCILTTLSTTTYLALFFLALFYLSNYFAKRPALIVFLLAGMIGLFMASYSKLDFLNKKIEKQIAYSNKGVPGESRFNSFIADMKLMRGHEVIGTGRNIEMKFGKNFYNLNHRLIHRNNGVGVLLSTYGIPFFLLFFFFTWRTFYAVLQTKTNAWMAISLLIVIGFSEDYFFKSFFIALALYSCVKIIPKTDRTVFRERKLKLGRNLLTYE
jgi:hypothetical protein